MRDSSEKHEVGASPLDCLRIETLRESSSSSQQALSCAQIMEFTDF